MDGLFIQVYAVLISQMPLVLNPRQVRRACQVRDMLDWSRDMRTERIQAYFEAINTYLSDKLLTGGDNAEPVYIFDKEKPTLVDATVFGFMANLLVHPT